MSQDCDFTLLPTDSCAHCTGALDVIDERDTFVLGEGTKVFGERGKERSAATTTSLARANEVKTRQEREHEGVRILTSNQSIQEEYNRNNPMVGRRGPRTWQANVRDVHEGDDTDDLPPAA